MCTFKSHSAICLDVYLGMGVFKVRTNTLITKFEERMLNIHYGGQQLFVEDYLNFSERKSKVPDPSFTRHNTSQRQIKGDHEYCDVHAPTVAPQIQNIK
jgi:hypothetical protein